MSSCAQHPNTAPTFRCDSCERLLCEACAEESYRLFLCSVCGERALPLDDNGPVDTQVLAQERMRAAPYSLSDTFAYPFRGTGLYILFVTMIVVFLRGFGLLALVIMSLLIAALQFHIVRCTVRGENELETWPDFTAWSELVPDLLAWIILEGSLQMLLAAYIGVGLLSGLFGMEPSLIGAVIMAGFLWLATAFQVMGYGAAANFGLGHVFMIHLHIAGYRATLGDALRFTNLMFGLRGLVFVVQGGLAALPILGGILSGILTVYWIFLVPHLSGLLYRRHEKMLDRLYIGR